MDPEIKRIIDKYVAAAKNEAEYEYEVWLALAYELFMSEIGLRDRIFLEEISCFIPDDILIDYPLHYVLTEEERDKLLDSAKEAIDYCCLQYQAEPYSYEYIHIDSPTLAKLMVDVAAPKAGESIYLPFCGLGEIALNLSDFDNYEKVIADELYVNVWALSYMRISIYKGWSDKSKFIYDYNDSFHSMSEMRGSKSHRFDLIIMSPTESQDDETIFKAQHVVAIKDAFPLLKSNGRMVVALPAEFMHDTSINALCEYLMDRAALKSVRYVPDACMKLEVGSNDFCVLEISANHQEEVTFIDGDASINVPYNKLIPTNLLPSAYINVDDYDGEYIRLGDCLQAVSAHSTTVPLTRQITINDLTYYDYLDCTINFLKLDSPTWDQSTYSVTWDRTLFIDFREYLKIGMYIPKDLRQSVCWDPSTLAAFEVKDDKIMLEYLLRELLSEKMSFRMAKYLNEEPSPDRLSEFLDIKIPLPPIDEQMKIVFEDTRRHLSGAQAALVQAQEEHMIDIRLRKHTLISKVAAYKMKWRTLRKALERNDGKVDLHDTVTNTSSYNFYEFMDGMQALFEEINRQLKVLTDDKDDIDEAMPYHPDKLVSEYCDDNKPTVCRYTIVDDIDPKVAISISKKALFRVFDNIVNNAISHGFTDPERDDYEIRFQTIASTDSVTILIANNGAPLSQELLLEEVFELGRSTQMYKDGHGGEGGYDIRRILKLYDATASVESHPDSEFTVVYKLIFHRSNE